MPVDDDPPMLVACHPDTEARVRQAAAMAATIRAIEVLVTPVVEPGKVLRIHPERVDAWLAGEVLARYRLG